MISNNTGLVNNKKPERDKIKADIEAYLSAGNEIEKLDIIKRATDKPHNFTLHTGNKK